MSYCDDKVNATHDIKNSLSMFLSQSYGYEKIYYLGLSNNKQTYRESLVHSVNRIKEPGQRVSKSMITSL